MSDTRFCQPERFTSIIKYALVIHFDFIMHMSVELEIFICYIVWFGVI